MGFHGIFQWNIGIFQWNIGIFQWNIILHYQHSSANLTLVEPKHQRRRDVVGQGGHLLLPKHHLHQREDALRNLVEYLLGNIKFYK